MGGVDGHRRREGCGRRCCRRGRQRGDIRAACVRRRRSTKSSPITWAMTSTIRPGAVSITVLVNALSTHRRCRRTKPRRARTARTTSRAVAGSSGVGELTIGTSSLVPAADVTALMVSVIVGPSRQAHARRVEPLPPTFGYSLRVPMTFHLSLSSGSERIGRRRGLNGDPSGVGVGLDVGCGGAEAR